MKVSDLPPQESRILELAAELGYDDVAPAEEDADEFASEDTREP